MKRILFMLIPLMLAIMAFRPVFSHVITGKVLDEQGNPVPGVTIMIKGTNTSTLTAADGSFTITVKDDKAVLVFSGIGYTQQEIKIKGKTTISVNLKNSTAALQEVVVTGYGTQKRRNVTGSTTQVYSGDMAAAPMRGNKYASVPPANGYHNFGGIDKEYENFNTEGYDHISENRFLKVSDNPLSTFSIDVDAASYSNVRRFLNQGQLPPAGAVRIEEMINYFHYDYPQPGNNVPFSINTEISDAPWNKDHKLVLRFAGKENTNRRTSSF
jgi:Ca-activated chloride channel family protein